MRKFALTALLGLMVVGTVPADETIAEREAFVRGEAAKKAPASPKKKFEKDDDEDAPRPCRNSKNSAAASADEDGSFLNVAPKPQAAIDPCNMGVAAAGVGSPTVISRTHRWVVPMQGRPISIADAHSMINSASTANVAAASGATAFSTQSILPSAFATQTFAPITYSTPVTTYYSAPAAATFAPVTGGGFTTISSYPVDTGTTTYYAPQVTATPTSTYTTTYYWGRTPAPSHRPYGQPYGAPANHGHIYFRR